MAHAIPSISRGRLLREAVLACLVLAALAAWQPRELVDNGSVVQAYIGPGAGIALVGSFLAVLVAMLSALVALITWPIRWLWRMVRGRRARSRAKVRRVVILGLDGLDPQLVDKFLEQGLLPNLAKLRDQGTYTRLGTTWPPLSPVAWSSFSTGANPGKHNIFDFIMRSRIDYRPRMSSVHIHPPRRTLRLGKYRLPLSQPRIEGLRKSKPFWTVLGEAGVFSSVLRVPITFPPDRFRGVQLSAMCVPDLRGTQGTFSYYTTRPAAEEEHIGGEQFHVQRQGDTIRCHLIGPATPAGNGGPMRCPFEVRITGPGEAVLTVCGETFTLKKGVYTPWVTVAFKGGLGLKVKGICEFLLLDTEPEFELYVMPVQIDPDKPVLPISHPSVFATYLSKTQGKYATLGLAEDTWALNARILSDDAFLHQCIEADTEREVMFFDGLEKVRRGLCVCVFDGTDRIQHKIGRASCRERVFGLV